MAYRSVSNAIGFSLKPPKWLRNLVSSVTGGAVKVTNPLQPGTPAAGNPTALDFTAGNTPAWVWPAAAVGGGLLLAMVMRKGRRSKS